jgi:hypothetical protein
MLLYSVLSPTKGGTTGMKTDRPYIEKNHRTGRSKFWCPLSRFSKILGMCFSEFKKKKFHPVILD